MKIIKQICLTALLSSSIFSVNAQADEIEIIQVTDKAGAANQSNDLVLIVQQLQQEIRSLRGKVESQQFQLDQLQHLQKEMYSDLNSRLGGGGSAFTNTSANNSQQTGQSFKLSGNEQQDYSKAFSFVKTQELSKAASAFQEYMKRHPKAQRVSNAVYWLGEVNLAQGKLPEASDYFSRLISEYPKSAKIPDAMYKLGRVNQRMGDSKNAIAIWNSLVSQYPKAAAANLAKNALK